MNKLRAASFPLPINYGIDEPFHRDPEMQKQMVQNAWKDYADACEAVSHSITSNSFDVGANVDSLCKPYVDMKMLPLIKNIY